MVSGERSGLDRETSNDQSLPVGQFGVQLVGAPFCGRHDARLQQVKAIEQATDLVVGTPSAAAERRLPYIHEAVLRAYVQNASYHGLGDDDLEALLEPWTSATGHPAFYRQITQYDEQFLVDNEQRLDDLTLPVHVVWGRDDTWIPLQTGQRLAALITDAKFTEVPQAGHLIQYDSPVFLANLISTWLTEQADSTSSTD